MANLFDRDMTVMGGRVSAEWLSAAWERSVSSGKIEDLERHLHRTGPVEKRDAPFPDDYPSTWYVSEIRNRMLQKARKAGVIAMQGKPRRWAFVNK